MRSSSVAAAGRLVGELAVPVSCKRDWPRSAWPDVAKRKRGEHRAERGGYRAFAASEVALEVDFMNGLHSRRRTGTFARFVEPSAVKADSEYRLAGGSVLSLVEK